MLVVWVEAVLFQVGGFRIIQDIVEGCEDRYCIDVVEKS